MNDSPETVEQLKAKILEDAQKQVEELEQAAEIAKKYNLRLTADAEVSEQSNERLEKHSQVSAKVTIKRASSNKSGKPSRTKSGRLRHVKSWTKTILEIAAENNRGLTYAELKHGVSKTHLGPRLKETDKAFYGSIAKLRDTGKLIQHKGRFYTPGAYAQFQQDVEAGRIKDLEPPAQKGQASPAKLAILAYLKGGRSADTADIIDMLLANAETKESVEKNKTPVYNLLSRMHKRGELGKKDNAYCIPPNKNEAPAGEPEGASENGRADPLLFESREGGIRRTLHG